MSEDSKKLLSPTAGYIQEPTPKELKICLLYLLLFFFKLG